MKSRYVTYILRMRFDSWEDDPAARVSIHGSFQEVGLENTHHFNSFDKFLDVFREAVYQAAFPSDALTGQDPL